jgi:glycosyltransferase involved in cell wall biosynthesis
MRIAHVTSYQVHSYGYEEINLARAQARAGHEVAIFTSNYLHPKGQYAVLATRFVRRKVRPGNEEVDGVTVVRLPAAEILGRVWICRLTKAIRRYRPDVVHAHNLLQFHPLRLVALKAASGGHPKLVVDDHMHYSVMRTDFLGANFYRMYRHVVQPQLQRRVDAFCGISVETQRYLSSECGVQPPVRLMPLGVDTSLFRPNTRARVSFRHRLGAHDDDLVVIYTGKVIEPKGPHVLIDAALQLLDTGLKLHVVCIGDRDVEYFRTLQSRVLVAGHSGRFHFLDSLPHEELARAYAGADVGVWPRQESIAILEAMSSGLPVVVASGSGYSELVEQNGGLLFTADDPESLGGALLRLAAPGTRRIVGAEARAFVAGQLSWDSSAQRYLQLYASVL